MKTITNILTATLLVLLLHSTAVAQLNPAFVARLDHILDSVCAKRNLKGVTAAVNVPGAGTWKGVYGLAASGTAMTPDMVSGIGSNTKTFMATMLLLLQEQGKLGLDDKISNWIPSHPNINGNITIRQLLNHTSGLFSFTSYDSFNDSLISDFQRIWKSDEIYGFIKEPYFQPGADWAYSNTNYFLAGIIIEKVTGKTLHTALREMILEPHGLQHTWLFPDETPADEFARPWSLGFGTSYLNDGTGINYSNNAMFSLAWAAGAIVSTAEDNALFWSKLANGEIINENSWREMREVIKINLTTYYGLGIFKYSNFNGHTVFSHGGTNVGYINENVVDSTNGISVSVLTNQDSLGNSFLLTQLVRHLHKASTEMKVAGMEKAEDNSYIRIYPNPSQGAVRLITEGQVMQKNTIVRIYDLSGRAVFEKNVTGTQTELWLSDLSGGVYMVCVSDKAGNLLHRQKLQLID